MDLLLILVIILLYSFQTLFQTFYAKAYPGKDELSTSVFCILESVAIVLVTWAFIGFRFSLSWPTLLIGVLNAAALFGYNTSLLKASTKGSYAFMNVMMLAGGILVPMVYLACLGIFPNWYQYIAIATMLLSFVLMNIEDIKLKGTPTVYYILCAALFLFNGLYGTFIKVQNEINAAQSKEMIILTFGIMGIIAIFQLVAKEKKETIKAFKLNKKSLFWLILCLASAALAINCLVLVVGIVENTAILYTIENGGVLIVSALYSIFLFKEKPTVAKICGILLAAASMVVLSLP